MSFIKIIFFLSWVFENHGSHLIKRNTF